MKKQFTLLLVTLLGMLGFAAKADISVTFDVSGKGSVSVESLDGSNRQALQMGESKVTLPGFSNTYYVLVPGDNTEIESIKCSDPYVTYTVTNLADGKKQFGAVYGGDKIVVVLKEGSSTVKPEPEPEYPSTVLDIQSDAEIAVYCYSPWGKVETFGKGEHTVKMPYSTYRFVALGVSNQSDFIVKANGEGNPLWVFANTPFGNGDQGVYVQVTTSNLAAKYTIEVKDQPVVPETKDFIINLTGKAVLKYLDNNTWNDIELISGKNNVSVPKTVSTINVLAIDDYVLESCVSKEGVTISPTKSYSFPGYPNVFKIPVDNLSASYTIVTKKPVKNIVLDVLTADADIVLFNASSWYKDKKLVAGENTVEIPADKYYIVANGVTNPARLVVKGPDGQELPVKDTNNLASGANGVYVEFESATAPAKYTIEVKEEAPEPTTYDFNVTLTGKAVIKYQDASNEFVNVPLNEGANAIQIPRSVTTFFFVAEEGYELVSCNDLTIYVSDLGDTYRVFTASLAGTYTLVTKEATPVVTTFTLNIDNIDNVSVTDINYKPIAGLVSGENILDPTTCPNVQIRQNGMAPKPIYSCTLDGEPIQEVYAAYIVNPTKAGQVIDVVTVWPDVKYTIDLAYTNAQGVWTSYSLGDDNPISDDPRPTQMDIVDNKIEVEAGITVNLYSDEINKFIFNEQDSWGTPVITGLKGEQIPVVTKSGSPNATFNATKSGTITTDATKKVEIPVTINIDGDPANVKVTYALSNSDLSAYKPILNLISGANTFTIEKGYEIGVTPLNDATVTMTYKVSGDDEIKNGITYMGSLYTEAFTGLGAEVNITITGGTGPVYDKEFAVNIDGFGGKLMYRPDGGYTLFRNLKPGLNNVGLTAEDQKLLGGQLYIVPAEGWDFTECTDADGNPITIQSGNRFPSYVDVYTYAPRSEYNFKGVSTDKDVTLTLEGPADFWTKILVNKNEVTPEDGKLNIRYNDMVELYNQDIAAWKVNSIIDPATGKQVYISGYTEYPLLAFNIKGDWTLTVDAHRLAIYDVTVNVTNTNLVRLRKGTSNITLRNGENTIQVSELDTNEFYVSLRDADRGYIVAVQSQANADAELVPAEFEAGVYTIAGFNGNGGVLNIDVQAEAEALVYTDKATNLIDCKENAIALTEGYNHVALHYADAPFAFEGEPAVYVNYEALEGGLTLRADDICKVFYEAAQPLTVTFTVAPAEEGMGEADAAFANVTRDYVTNVEDVTAPFTVMPGTFLSFMTATAEGLQFEVTVNGEKVEGVENVYTTTITADTEIKLVYTTEKVGITTISRDRLDLNAVYFDLAGRRIDARNIAAGIYIRVAGNTATKIAVK